MFDEADDGVTAEYFWNSINSAYQDIMIDTNAEHYESKEFKYPPFIEQLDFVCNTKLQLCEK